MYGDAGDDVEADIIAKFDIDTVDAPDVETPQELPDEDAPAGDEEGEDEPSDAP